MKLSQKKTSKVLTEEEIETLAHTAVSSTLGNSTLDNLQNFCTEYVNRLGPESFQSFIAKHESSLTKLIYIPHYKAYLKSCFKFFKDDYHLLQLLVCCDFRQLNSDSIPKLIREDTFDNEHQIEHRSQYYLKMMPKQKWIFNDYPSNCDLTSIKINQLCPVYLSESDIPHLETDSDIKSLTAAKLKKSISKKPVIDRIITFTQKPFQNKQESN